MRRESEIALMVVGVVCGLTGGFILYDSVAWAGRALFIVGTFAAARLGWILFSGEDDAVPDAASAPAAPAAPGEPAPRPYVRVTGSLSRRMILIAAAWIMVLLTGGGFALDRVLSSSIEANFDNQLDFLLNTMLVSAEIGPEGEVRFSRELADHRFLEPGSGLYYQVSGAGFETFPSQSLWDRTLRVTAARADNQVHTYDSKQFGDEKLRVMERDVTLPGSPVRWKFQVAQSRIALDEQIEALRRVLIRSFLLLGAGLIIMVALQTGYGLLPLREVRLEIQRMRAGKSTRVEGAMPAEVAPMVEELNALVAHNDRQAEEARRHAGNLAHALKTPLTVIMNAAAAGQADLAETVVREARTMRRQVDHHLARARAVGRRGSAHSRAEVWPSIQAVERAVARLYPNVRIDVDGTKDLVAHIERQDLDEIMGNLVENAAKYGGGSVFVTVGAQAGFVEMLVEDDGVGIPEADRIRIFDRGVRLDSGKPGTGLGLAIVRDVAEIYEGTVSLEESEDLGGLLVRLRLPAA